MCLMLCLAVPKACFAGTARHSKAQQGLLPAKQGTCLCFACFASHPLGHKIDIPTFSFEKSIKFTEVSFRYLNTEKDALCELSFEINKGEIIGIVGETGSGKSTLVDVLLGLLRPCKGSVLVDDEYTVNSYQWHKEIGYVPQSIYLTDDTIYVPVASLQLLPCFPASLLRWKQGSREAAL